MIIHQTGDLFTTDARAIGHGVNVDGIMGSGIALQFKERFPDMHNEYKKLCKSGELEPGGLMVYEQAPGLYIYNLASQDRPGANASYEWLSESFRRALGVAEADGLKEIALPRIGSGIGGLNERQVEGMIADIIAPTRVNVEIWSPPQKDIYVVI